MFEFSNREKKLQQVVLEIMGRAGSVSQGCAVAGVSLETFDAWRASDEGFDEEILRLRKEAMGLLLMDMQRQASGHLVDEWARRETDFGTTVTTRQRWVTGKVAVLKMLFDQVGEALRPVARSADDGSADGADVKDEEPVEVSDFERNSGSAEGADVGGSEPVEVSDFERNSGSAEGADVGGSEPVEVSDFERNPGSAKGTDAGGAEPVEVSDFEGNSGSVVGADVGGLEPVEVSDFERRLGASRLRNQRRNRRQALAKALGKKGRKKRG